MAKKRTRTRVSSKIDELPEALRVKVDVMLADTSNTYEYISQYLKQEGYEISKSSVGTVSYTHLDVYKRQGKGQWTL